MLQKHHQHDNAPVDFRLYTAFHITQATHSAQHRSRPEMRSSLAYKIPVLMLSPRMRVVTLGRLHELAARQLTWAWPPHPAFADHRKLDLDVLDRDLHRPILDAIDDHVERPVDKLADA